MTNSPSRTEQATVSVDPNTAGDKRLAKAILDMLNAHWNERQSVMFLAHLGARISKDNDLNRLLLGRKLGHFLDTVMSGAVHVVTDPKRPLVKGLIPASGGAESAPFPEPTSIRTVLQHGWQGGGARYTNAIVVAFTRPLEAGHIRQLRLNPVPKFQDVPEASRQTDPHDSWLEITAADIDPGAAAGATFDDSKLKTWCTRNSIEIAALEYRARADDCQWSRSVLGGVIGALSPDDMRRLVIPLDIVAKLLKTPR